jgi:hypothetical protein
MLNQHTHSSVSLIADKFHHTDQFKKPGVPKKDEKPIMGLVSDKNYIVANAVENILAGTYSNFNLFSSKVTNEQG